MHNLATHALHLLPPEAAHEVAIKLLRWMPARSVIADLDLKILQQEFCGLSFPHPLGLAAGFDKHAEVFDKLGLLGFSFVELGSITPRPQPGNPKPRLFRLPQQQAIINCYGFNSKGQDYAAQCLQKYPRTAITGINLGKNKTTVNAADDFLQGAEHLITQADYFTINVSSPNTPGLRDLQTSEALDPIIDGVRAIMQNKKRKVPLFIKLSPDIPLQQESSLIEFLVAKAIDGIIISNTTSSREGVENNEYAAQSGGLSGPPLKARSTAMLRRVYNITQGRVLLIGCGGISTGLDAYEKLCAGANLLQLYTALIYQGPLVIRKILLELQAILSKNGIRQLAEIIGSKE